MSSLLVPNSTSFSRFIKREQMRFVLILKRCLIKCKTSPGHQQFLLFSFFFYYHPSNPTLLLFLFLHTLRLFSCSTFHFNLVRFIITDEWEFCQCILKVTRSTGWQRVHVWDIQHPDGIYIHFRTRSRTQGKRIGDIFISPQKEWILGSRILNFRSSYSVSLYHSVL